MRKCKRCDRPAQPRVQFCFGHWLLRQSADVQSSAATERRREFDKTGQEPVKSIPKALLPNGEKYCYTCQSYLPDFYMTGTKCRGCSSRDKHALHVEATYGISRDDYTLLLESQGGRCAICGNQPRKYRLAVDHDHKTGEVRGLLCKTCNHDLLGGAKEDPAILRRAADYLETPPARATLTS